MSESEESIVLGTPEEIKQQATIVINELIPEKSKNQYEKAYADFMQWRKRNGISSFSETIFIVYFEELSKKWKPTSVWSHYSMIKSTINIKHDVDISTYSKVTSLLKRKSEGYIAKKSKVFSSEEIKTFLDEAPDEVHLLTKVSMVFGIMGACRRIELHQLKIANVKDLGSHLLVTLPTTKNKKPRSFTVTGKYYELCKKYMKLRPQICPSQAFFLNYQKGKCTSQNVGINKFGSMGKVIAAYLNLPDPELYTGHCFRRSSATLLVDAGGDILQLKRHGGWKSSTVAESYVDDSMTNKIEVSNKLLNSVNCVENNVAYISAPSFSRPTEEGFFPNITFNNCTINQLTVGSMQREGNMFT